MALRRNVRTIFLALVATAVFAWSAIQHFDVAPADLYSMLWMSLALVALAMLLAALVLAIRALLRIRR
jgi:TRAP-type C4-dicarboxylate transport system permease small subunit